NLFFFFFQAEDGIRDRNVTGVQTCALPIFSSFYLLNPLFRLCYAYPYVIPPKWGYFLPSSSSSIMPFVDSLNSCIVLPKAFPISGNLLGPNIISASTKIKIKLGTPILAIALPPYWI